jgi:hypothetical protein
VSSYQTRTAYAVASRAEVALRAHCRGCADCATARLNVDYCDAGWALARQARADRATARASAELDRAVPDGQDGLF